MNFFAKPKQPAQQAQDVFVGADYIKECELTIAREDVQRLRDYRQNVEAEAEIVADKLTRIRAFEREWVGKEGLVNDKLASVTRMLKAKERALFELEQDAR